MRWMSISMSLRVTIIFSNFAKVKKAVHFLVPISLKTPHTKFRQYMITLTRASSHLNISTFPHWVCMGGLPGIGSHPITQDLLDRSRRSMHQPIQRMRFHDFFLRWLPWVISATFKGQGVTFPSLQLWSPGPKNGKKLEFFAIVKHRLGKPPLSRKLCIIARANPKTAFEREFNFSSLRFVNFDLRSTV